LNGSNATHRLALATGAAFAYQTQQTGSVVVAFAKSDEILQSRGTIAYALKNHLPILYVQLGEASSRTRKHDSSFNGLAIVPVDQADVVAIYRVAYEAIEKARRRAGPTLIQCLRYESARRKRTAEDSHGNDPLSYMERYLKKKGLWSDDFKSSLLESFSNELNLAVKVGRSNRSTETRSSRKR